MFQKLDFKNVEMIEKLKKLSELILKEKFQARSIQISLEENLNKSQGHLPVSLERNGELNWEPIHSKKEINKPLKWTALSQNLANMTSRRLNHGKGLGCQHVNPP